MCYGSNLCKININLERWADREINKETDVYKIITNLMGEWTVIQCIVHVHVHNVMVRLYDSDLNHFFINSLELCLVISWSLECWASPSFLSGCV